MKDLVLNVNALAETVILGLAQLIHVFSEFEPRLRPRLRNVARILAGLNK